MNKFTGRVTEFCRIPGPLVIAAPVIVIGTARLSYAIVISAALIWTYGVSLGIVHRAGNLFPKKIFANILPLTLYSFVGSLFLLVTELLNPVLAAETSLLVCLAPALCFAGDISGRTEGADYAERMNAAFFEAGMFSVFIILLSLIREPLGYGTLTLPSVSPGAGVIFRIDEAGFPIRVIASSSGALLLSGYIFLVFRMMKPKPEGSK